ncbi:hypothetical protein EON82_03465 [bacterium]|nr:MAG: hypothetical protein EON82_03465 [bacterium]
MRRAFLLLLSLLAAMSGAQLRPDESRALDDAMTLANVRAADLASATVPPGALAVQAEALKNPIAGFGEANALHAAAISDENALLKRAQAMIGNPAKRPGDAGIAETPAALPEPLRRPVGLLISAIAATNAEIRASTTRLSPEEKRTLLESLPRLATRDQSLLLDFAKAPSPDFATVRRLIGLVDVNRIQAAGLSLNAVVQEVIPELRSAAGLNLPTAVFRSRGIVIELSGVGSQVHGRRDVGLCIDLGGDDRYTGRYAAGAGYAGVLIDLGGNDRYYGSDLNLGAGLIGVGLLYDLSGEDVYAVRSIGLGCGLAGVGVCSDGGGDDRYRVVGLGLGSAAGGIGLFVDRLGDDAYFAGRCGQGFGTLNGVGWSVDGAGDDTYRGGAEVQAVGRDGGAGILTDLAGSDLYQAASGQASAVGGYASLHDAKGQDEYMAQSEGQAFASTGGVAYLEDREGDDSYLVKRGQGQAAGFGGIAMLFDRDGNDVYGGTDGTPATALSNGVAILLDSSGDDRYLASSSFPRSEDGIALWVDAGGRDRYGEGRGDAQAQVRSASAAYDVYGASEAAQPTIPAPAPGSVPMPPAAEFVNLRRSATDGPDRAAATNRLIGIGLPALDALASVPEGEPAFVSVASRMGNAAAPVVARLAASPDPRLVRLALLTAGYVPIPGDALLAALGRPEVQLLAAQAAGRSKANAAIPTLMALAASTEPSIVRAAMEALASIGDPQSASTASALIESSDFRTRRAAQRLLVSQPTTGVAAGKRLLTTGDPSRQRIGLELLGKIAAPDALAAIEPFLKAGGRETKISALIALDGHVPTEMIPLLEALRRDSDPLVRAVAERIDVGG